MADSMQDGTSFESNSGDGSWSTPWSTGGEKGLVPRYPATRKRRLPETTRDLIRIARVDHRYGAARGAGGSRMLRLARSLRGRNVWAGWYV